MGFAAHGAELRGFGAEFLPTVEQTVKKFSRFISRAFSRDRSRPRGHHSSATLFVEGYPICNRFRMGLGEMACKSFKSSRLQVSVILIGSALGLKI